MPVGVSSFSGEPTVRFRSSAQAFLTTAPSSPSWPATASLPLVQSMWITFGVSPSMLPIVCVLLSMRAWPNRIPEAAVTPETSSARFSMLIGSGEKLFCAVIA